MVNESDIHAAIEQGGRVNAFYLLAAAHRILLGQVPPSPTLANWLGGALHRILEGESADRALGLQKKPGPDPLPRAAAMVDRDFGIHEDVTRMQRERRPLAGNATSSGAFDLVAEDWGISLDSVRKAYYSIEEVERISDFGPAPKPENIDPDQESALLEQIFELVKNTLHPGNE